MNYEDMSDLVIDRKVFVKIYGECIGDKDMHRVWQDNKFRPCSNPSNAWPIIVDNKINIEWRDSLKLNPLAKGTGGNACHWSDKNPLRAAMICFLKMKDAGL